LKLNFVQPQKRRGGDTALPFAILWQCDDHRRSHQWRGDAVEDGKAAGALFSGVEEKIEVKREELIRVYEQIGRTADDLPYTPDFEKLHAAYGAQHREKKPEKRETWRHLLNLRRRKNCRNWARRDPKHRKSMMSKNADCAS